MSKKKHVKPFSLDRKPGRNDLCPCKSGRKSKKCCFGPVAQVQQQTPYGSFWSTIALSDVNEHMHAFVRRWGYHPGMAELSCAVEGIEDQMVNIVVRKLAALDANPKWIEAAKTLKMLVTELNVEQITEEEAAAWNELIGDTPITIEKHCEEGCECPHHHHQATSLPGSQ